MKFSCRAVLSLLQKPMIRTILGLTFFAVCFGFAGCSSAKREQVKLDDTSTKTTKLSGDVRTQQPAPTPVISAPDLSENDSNQQQTQTYGAKVVKSYDADGTLTELRNFDSDPSVKYVLVRTTQDGQKQGVIGGADGQTKPLPADLVYRAMSASATELAAMLKPEPPNSGSTVPVAAQPPASTSPNKNNQTASTQTSSSETPKTAEVQQTKQTQPSVVFEQLPRRKG
jgi:hypothetical protein